MTTVSNTDSQRKPWVRLYRESLHNPKIVTLSDRLHRVWHNCLLIADDAGRLPSMRDIACHLRMTIPEAEQSILDLVEAGLIDADAMSAERVYTLHDWGTHQYVSDLSTERVRKYREKSKTARNETAMKRFSNDDETPPDTDTDTENNLTTVEQDAARDQKFDFKNLIGKGRRGVKPRLKARAEGLGLPADDLELRATAEHIENPSGMFRHLCVEHMRRQLPLASTATLKAAMSERNDAAFATVCQMLLEVAP